MIGIPGYNKVLTLGAQGTENALVGPVLIQEKVDGSQFRFGLNENEELIFASHHKSIYPPDTGMFTEAVASVTAVEDAIRKSSPDTYFYAEYLRKPKQNTLTYERVPKGHLMLFDVYVGSDGWFDHKAVQEIAQSLEMESAPVLYLGEATVDTIERLVLETDSFLGGTKIEGVVIKNYGQTIMVGSRIFNLFTKYVNETFKERNTAAQVKASSKGRIQELIESYRTEARWRKSVQGAQEAGELENAPRDIGKLVPIIQRDILEEETENIKAQLFAIYGKDITRYAVRGFAEWYKDRLAARLEED